MHDRPFEANVSHQPDALAQAKVDEMAREIGLDMERYQRDVNAPETQAQIAADQAQAAKLGANGTPHFFINGVRLSGAQPYETFKSTIDAQLRRAHQVLASGVARRDRSREPVQGGAPPPPGPPPRRPAPPPPQGAHLRPAEGPALRGD